MNSNIVDLELEYLISTDLTGVKFFTKLLELYLSVKTGAFTKILELHILDKISENQAYKILDDLHVLVLNLPATKNVRIADLEITDKRAYGLWLDFTQILLDNNRYLTIEDGAQDIRSSDDLKFSIKRGVKK